MGRVDLLLRQDRGQALVIALGVMAVLAATATTLFSYTATNSRTASRSAATQKAYAGAESGVNSAVAMLGLGTNNALDPCLLHPPTNPSGLACASHTPFTMSVDGGTVSFYGTFDQTSQLWTVTSSGTFANPTGPTAAPVTRTMRASVPISANQNDPANTAIWNYIISTKTSNSTTFDMWLQNTVQIDEPLFVAGNLCMNNSAQVLQPGATTEKLVKIGKIVLMSPQTRAGISSQPIYEANVGGG